jgi:H+/gluconate symporter-like permease
MDLLGILVALVLLVFLAFRGWSVLLLGPFTAMIAAGFAGEPLLAHWTQTFMGAAARFFASFFPLFLLGALFGKLMEDCGAVTAIADFMTEKLGPSRAILAVVLASAAVTFGGVSAFVAFFVLAPMAIALFRQGGVPRRLIPAAIMLGAGTFTMSAMPGTPAIQNAIPMPFFGTTAFAAPGIGIIASIIMFAFGMWWLGLCEKRARGKGEGFGDPIEVSVKAVAEDPIIRERATTAREFDPPEAVHGAISATKPPFALAAIPLVVVVAVNLALSMVILPRIGFQFLAEPRWGSTSLAAVSGVWAVAVGLAAAVLVLVATNLSRFSDLRGSITAGANAGVLPIVAVASLVGFGAVVAALPGFVLVRDWVLGIGGGPLVSLAVASNVLSALTGSASGGLTIALDVLGPTFMRIAAEQNIDPGLMHRIAVIGAGTLDLMPHSGAVVTLLALSGVKHGESYFDMVMACIVGPLIALVIAIVIGTYLGSF